MKATSQTLKRAAALLVLGAALTTAPAYALKSDRSQPAVINADNVELDFKNGSRTYTGNVSVQQGSMQLICDRLIATFQNNKLAKATAFGSSDKLAIFKQRPDGKPYDVVGRAEEMVLDEIQQIVTLTKTASLQQGADSVAGDTIIYNMSTDKMEVKGRSETQIKRQPEAKAPAPTPTPAAPTPAKTSADLDKTRKALPAAPSRPKSASEIAIVTPAPPPKPTPPKPMVVAPQPTEEEAAANRVAANTGTRVTTTPTGRVRIVLPPRSKRKAQN